MPEEIRTQRLVVRDWTDDDAPAALAVYGHPDVARWLVPEVGKISDEADMRAALRDWAQWTRTAQTGLGYWAVVHAGTGR